MQAHYSLSHHLFFSCISFFCKEWWGACTCCLVISNLIEFLLQENFIKPPISWSASRVLSLSFSLLSLSLSLSLSLFFLFLLISHFLSSLSPTTFSLSLCIYLSIYLHFNPCCLVLWWVSPCAGLSRVSGWTTPPSSSADTLTAPSHHIRSKDR